MTIIHQRQPSDLPRFPHLPRLPILELLHPRQHMRASLLMFLFATLIGALGVNMFRLPLWNATALVLVLMLIPGVQKWRTDLMRYGGTAMLLSIILVAQGFHGIEHLTQWVQYHVLHWEMRKSVGLLSAANSEWVHFVWNWLVLIVFIVLICNGMRGPWAWMLLGWSLLHTIEHSYMFMRYLNVLGELRQLGVTNVTAQGLPGVLGRDGWLAKSDATRGTFLCTLPGLATAPRLDVHFWWNVGETALLFLAGNSFMQQHLQDSRVRKQRVELRGDRATREIPIS